MELPFKIGLVAFAFSLSHIIADVTNKSHADDFVVFLFSHFACSFKCLHYIWQELNECLSQPCKNGATCNDLLNHYTCDCMPGFSGTNCQTNVDDCVGVVCNITVSNSECQDGVNTHSCVCSPGYTGRLSVCLLVRLFVLMWMTASELCVTYQTRNARMVSILIAASSHLAIQVGCPSIFLSVCLF